MISQQELRKRIMNLVWPVTVESVLQMGVGLVNTAMVGHLSAAAIGAVGLSNRATMVCWALFQAISTGVTVLVAQSIGAGDSEHARRIAAQGILFGTASVLALSLAFFALARPILAFFRPSEDVLESGIRYMRIVSWSMPAVGIMTACGAGLRGAGDTRAPMLVAFLVNILNVVGNWLLIYGKLGLPTLGITGSALATVFAQWIGAILALQAATGMSSVLGLRKSDLAHFSRKELASILGMGVPAAGESLFWQAAAIVLTFFITGFGTTALAAHQLGLNAESISYMPTAGFGIAATTLVGQAVGAGDFKLCRRYSRELGLWAVLLTAFTASLLFFIPEAILGLLTSDPAVVSLGAIYLRFMAVAQIPQQFSGVLGGAIRGSGDTKGPMFVAMLGLWGIRLPLAYILAYKFDMGVIGVWAGMTIDLLVRSSLIWLKFRKITRTVWKEGLVSQ